MIKYIDVGKMSKKDAIKEIQKINPNYKPINETPIWIGFSIVIVALYGVILWFH